MGISYKKLRDLLDERNINNYTLTKKIKLIGQATWKRLMEDGCVDTDTICKLCKFLDVQPGDILEYVPDEEKD